MGGVPMLGDPPRVLPLHIGQHSVQQRRVARHLIESPHRGAVPVAVAARLRAGSLEPVARKVGNDRWIVQPPDLVELVTQWTANGPVRARPEWPIEEFSECVT